MKEKSEKQREYMRQRLIEEPDYYAKQYQKRKEYCKKWNSENKEQQKINKKRWCSLQPWRPPIYAARARCSKRDIPYDLSFEWGESRWTGRCELTDIPFVVGEYPQHPMCASLDRITPNLGYTQDNCRFILFGINALKGSGTDEDVYLIAKAIVDKKDTR